MGSGYGRCCFVMCQEYFVVIINIINLSVNF